MLEIKIFSDHQWAFYYWFCLKKNFTLCHFDAHADLASPFIKIPKKFNNKKAITDFIEKKLSVANFIVPAVYLGLVKEIYWILPNWAKDGTKYFDYYWQEIAKTKLTQSYQANINKEYQDIDSYNELQEIKNNEIIYSKQKNFFLNIKKDKYDNISAFCSIKKTNNKSIKVNKIYLAEIEKEIFKEHKNHFVFDFDLDYFNCTGFDTFGTRLLSIEKEELKKNIKTLVCIFKKNNLYPTLLTIATSPNYTPLQDIDFLVNQFSKELENQAIKFKITKENIKYNLQQILLLKNICLKIRHIINIDPRNKGSILTSEINDFFKTKINIWQYSIPDQCYFEDDFSLFFKEPYKKINSLVFDFCYFLEELKNKGLNHFHFDLTQFLDFYFQPNSKIKEIKSSFLDLRKKFILVIKNPSSFDKQLLYLKNKFKKMNKINIHNKTILNEFRKAINQFKKEFTLE